MVILKTYREERVLIKCYVIKHLILLKTQTMIDISVGLLQWFIIFFDKKQNVTLIKSKYVLNEQLLKVYLSFNPNLSGLLRGWFCSRGGGKLPPHV